MKLTVILASVMLVLLTSCLTDKVPIERINNLHRGMLLNDAINMFEEGTFLKDFGSLYIKKARLIFDVPTIDNKGTVKVYCYRFEGQSYFFSLAFINDKLLFWGFPHEFNRNWDKSINHIGQEIVLKIFEIDGDK